ncbi:MAG: amidohydrolase family protein [Bacteroidetes bacterium]|jgi:predicted TIM-barrel fold metal-dependent hydrolase|nr:amidohydrolase family protein [Bacteroidota bacterium]
MKKTGLILLLFFITSELFGQTNSRYTGPIIDMHLHAYTNEGFGEPVPNPATGMISLENAAEHRRLSIELMKKHNIVLSMVDGKSPAAVDPWVQELGENRIIRGFRFLYPEKELDLDLFKERVEHGKIEIFGEVGTTYAGYSPSDSILDPYWEICEKSDIPVAIHTGGSSPGIHLQHPNFRLRFGDPFLVEDILVKYPELRVYLMHAGAHFYEETAMLMVQYPNLYVDIAVLNWVPDATPFLSPFLKLAKEYNVLDRVMFGTDQMRWPEAINMAIENIQGLDFLTLDEKKGIFYSNAARFLNLNEETIAKHHAK